MSAAGQEQAAKLNVVDNALKVEVGMQSTSTGDLYNLQRFVDAQAGIYTQARSELAAGKKRSHWMWFIFPQIRGLGSSPTAQHFAISGMDEAVAYLDHATLGARLRECTALVNELQGLTPNNIFGTPDDLKFHSSITLFAQAHQQRAAESTLQTNVFADSLAKYFAAHPDTNTLTRLR